MDTARHSLTSRRFIISCVRRGFFSRRNKSRTGLVVFRNIALTGFWIECGRHDAHELHHPAIFVGQDVAVEDIGASEVQIFLPDGNLALPDLFAICGDLPCRHCDHILPDVVANRLAGRASQRAGRRIGSVLDVSRAHRLIWINQYRYFDLDHLKRIDVDVERVGRVSPILENPILQPVERHALVNDLACLAELFAINHEVWREPKFI